MCLLILFPVTGLDYFGCASYGIAAVETGGKQMSAGHLHLMGSSPAAQYQKEETPKGCLFFLVPVTGLEPVRHRWRRILSFVTHLEIHGI